MEINAAATISKLISESLRQSNLSRDKINGIKLNLPHHSRKQCYRLQLQGRDSAMGTAVGVICIYIAFNMFTYERKERS